MKYVRTAALLCALLLPCRTVRAAETIGSGDADVLMQYQEYGERLSSIEYRSEIAENGFSVVENQIFPIEIAEYGEVSLIPAFEETYHRLALFFVTESGQVIYKTDQLETNNRVLGQMEQPDCSIAAVSFRDLDMDGRMDIILITVCTA
ncbi:MAG: VCBS repeat-containing protein, partial [Lachnospiraceae bacterium]|nr:VCBS repeat-containing protein [Lachnospiraceae bacterium]